MSTPIAKIYLLQDMVMHLGVLGKYNLPQILSSNGDGNHKYIMVMSGNEALLEEPELLTLVDKGLICIDKEDLSGEIPAPVNTSEDDKDASEEDANEDSKESTEQEPENPEGTEGNNEEPEEPSYDELIESLNQLTAKEAVAKVESETYSAEELSAITVGAKFAGVQQAAKKKLATLVTTEEKTAE